MRWTKTNYQKREIKVFTSCVFFHSQRRESTQPKQCKTCHIIVISLIRKLVVFQLSINWSYNISNTMYVLICKFVRSSYFKYQISEVIKYVLIWTYKCNLILLFFMLYLITWTQCISIIICLDKKKRRGNQFEVICRSFFKLSSLPFRTQRHINGIAIHLSKRFWRKTLGI